MRYFRRNRSSQTVDSSTIRGSGLGVSIISLLCFIGIAVAGLAQDEPEPAEVENGSRESEEIAEELVDEAESSLVPVASPVGESSAVVLKELLSIGAKLDDMADSDSSEELLAQIKDWLDEQAISAAQLSEDDRKALLAEIVSVQGSIDQLAAATAQVAEGNSTLLEKLAEEPVVEGPEETDTIWPIVGAGFAGAGLVLLGFFFISQSKANKSGVERSNQALGGLDQMTVQLKTMEESIAVGFDGHSDMKAILLEWRESLSRELREDMKQIKFDFEEIPSDAQVADGRGNSMADSFEGLWPSAFSEDERMIEEKQALSESLKSGGVLARKALAFMRRLILLRELELSGKDDVEEWGKKIQGFSNSGYAYWRHLANSRLEADPEFDIESYMFTVDGFWCRQITQMIEALRLPIEIQLIEKDSRFDIDIMEVFQSRSGNRLSVEHAVSWIIYDTRDEQRNLLCRGLVTTN